MPAELFLRQEFETAWAGRNPFDAARALQGVPVREVAQRSTIRFEMGGGNYYAKRHDGVGWIEILKNWCTFKHPVLDASNEYRAAARLKEHGLHTLEVAAYGRVGRNPATRQSFLITDEISPVISLEQFCLNWPDRPPHVRLKRDLIATVAQIAATMHGAGVNHRDFYICHFLLSNPDQIAGRSAALPPIYVVDLHRAQLRRRVPARWLIRDLAALWFSCFDIGLTRRDVLRFLSLYFGIPPRELLHKHATILVAVDRRAHRLYEKAERKGILPGQLASHGTAL